jgi:DNA-binding response OmpR family regulator
MDTVKRMLVFDDDQTIVQIIKYILEEDDWEVLGSDQSNGAIEKTRQFMPSIIMMDNNIPDFGGIATTQNIKKEKDLEHIPVIFFSASEDVENLAEQAGADAFLAKPFDMSKLNGIIDGFFPSVAL